MMKDFGRAISRRPEKSKLFVGGNANGSTSIPLRDNGRNASLEREKDGGAEQTGPFLLDSTSIHVCLIDFLVDSCLIRNHHHPKVCVLNQLIRCGVRCEIIHGLLSGR